MAKECSRGSGGRLRLFVSLQHWHHSYTNFFCFYTPSPRRGRGFCFTSVLPSVQDIFRHTFLSNCWWQKSDIWSQASYRYTILWVAFLDPSDSYFLFADLVGFYTHWTYMHIFLSNYWWQRSDIWSQASYRYPISWEAFLNPSDSYFLFAEERGYHKWALAHSSSCYFYFIFFAARKVAGDGPSNTRRFSMADGFYWKHCFKCLRFTYLAY